MDAKVNRVQKNILSLQNKVRSLAYTSTTSGINLIYDELKFNKDRLIQIQDSLDESGHGVDTTFETLFSALDKLLIIVGEMRLPQPNTDVRRFTLTLELKQEPNEKFG